MNKPLVPKGLPQAPSPDRIYDPSTEQWSLSRPIGPSGVEPLISQTQIGPAMEDFFGRPIVDHNKITSTPVLGGGGIGPLDPTQIPKP